MWLLGEPTLDSEWSVGARAAAVDLCDIGATDVGSSLVTRAVGSGRGPGAIARGTVVVLSRVRHVDWFCSGHFGKVGGFTDGK